MRGVLFDIGGVLVTDGPDMAAVAKALGLDAGPEAVARVGRAVWAERDAYDLGMGDAEYWRAVAAGAGVGAPTEESVRRLTAADVARWSRPHPEALDLVQELRADGLTLGVLSNAPRALAAGFRSQQWARAFEVAVFSCDTGVAKPATEAYARAFEAFGARDVGAGHIVFLDDRPANVAAARDAGLRAHLWTGAADARAFLIASGVPLGD